MHIDPAGVPCPHGRFAFNLGAFGAVVLLDAQIFDAMTGSPQGCEELRSAVKQGLTPLRMAGAHGEEAPLKLQWPAMGGQVFTRQLGPVLPDRGERSLAAPATAQSIQARPEGFRWRRWGGLQQLSFPEGPALGFRSPCHGRCRCRRVGVW